MINTSDAPRVTQPLPASVLSVSTVSRNTLAVSTAPSSLRSTSPAPPSSNTSTSSARSGATNAFAHLDLHLSLDIALELIHANREALKRVEIFVGYPGRCGHRVRDTIEEIFILLLRAMGERHISPGFERYSLWSFFFLEEISCLIIGCQGHGTDEDIQAR